jgi:ABC transporter substrate binding protein
MDPDGSRSRGRALGVRLQFVETRGPADFDGAFAEMTRARAGALTVLPSNMLINERRRLVDLAAKNGLPAVYGSREFVDAGGLMAYGPNFADMFRRAATYVDKILKGTKPADLPVEQPTKFELLINLKTAKALNLTIPQSVLLRADQVISKRARPTRPAPTSSSRLRWPSALLVRPRTLCSPRLARLLARNRTCRGRDAPPGLRPPVDSVRRARLARHVLHERNGALAH